MHSGRPKEGRIRIELNAGCLLAEIRTNECGLSDGDLTHSCSEDPQPGAPMDVNNGGEILMFLAILAGVVSGF